MFDRLRDSMAGATQAIKSLASAETLQDRMLQAFKAAAMDLEPLVRAMLLQNYSASGLKEQTGTLRRALSRVTVGIALTSGGGSLVIAMPRGGGKYKNGSSLYTVAGALNYGAVRAPQADVTIAQGAGFSSRLDLLNRARAGVTSTETVRRSVLGDKAKRTLKKAALSGKQPSLRARSRIVNVMMNGQALNFADKIVAQNNFGIKRNRKRSVKLANGVVVIRPKRFFYLSPAQLQVLNQKLRDGIQARLDAAA